MIGVIADTHGLLRPEALDALRGAELILHAGDIGSPAVLRGLETIAPVIAVRGNNDRGPWAEQLPLAEAVEIGGATLYMIHDVNALDLDPRAAGFSAVIAGHSHRPLCEERDGVLFFNPGSAGPRRFRLPTSVGRLAIADGQVRPVITTLIAHPASATRGRGGVRAAARAERRPAARRALQWPGMKSGRPHPVQ
jgi:putative phosphoesterase